MPLNLIRNDITCMKVDAIVNATDNSLLVGAGMDRAIHYAAGPGLLEECRRLRECETGDAKLTHGYNLPCRYVIHTVGPIWRGGSHGEADLLAKCYRKSLALALSAHCKSIAFPIISTGAYGYPKAEALRIAVKEITDFLVEHEMTVFIVAHSGEAVEVAGRLFGEITAYIDDVYVNASYSVHREPQWIQFPDNDWFGSQDAPDMAKPKSSLEESTTHSPLPTPGKTKKPQVREVWPEPSLPSLEEMLSQMDEGFPTMLLRKIDERQMTDVECYKRANIDRRLFNKIKNNPGYRPGKQTVLAFAIALELSLDETREMLTKAGFSLSRSNKADIVVEYCIRSGNYDIFEINQVLFKMDLQPLGY